VDVRGVLITSAKPDYFNVGADIGEFGALFRQGEAALLATPRPGERHLQRTRGSGGTDASAPSTAPRSVVDWNSVWPRMRACWHARRGSVCPK
jgi:enoyl-CoA hydratase/carnithine racemase